MSTAVALHENKPMAFSGEELDLIKNTICKGATDSELKLFLHQCRATGLNPLARQIYSVQRKEYRDGAWKDIRSIQVSIDGFRLIAERSGKYAGQVGPYWCGEDGEWKDVWTGKGDPIAAKVGVLRSDFTEPCFGVARFEAYAQKKKEGGLTMMWGKMGDVMIAKCAEALALRKAFPQELSGLYTSDEMAQADTAPDVKPYDVDTSKPESPFKVGARRNEFQRNVELSLDQAKTAEECNEIIKLNKDMFAKMRESGDERDTMSVESIQNKYRAVLVRLQTPHDAETGEIDDDGSAELAKAEKEREALQAEGLAPKNGLDW